MRKKDKLTITKSLTISLLTAGINITVYLPMLRQFPEVLGNIVALSIFFSTGLTRLFLS